MLFLWWCPFNIGIFINKIDDAQFIITDRISQRVGQYVPLRRRDFFFGNNLLSCLDGLPVDSEREGCFRSVAQGMRKTHQVHEVGHVEETLNSSFLDYYWDKGLD